VNAVLIVGQNAEQLNLSVGVAEPAAHGKPARTSIMAEAMSPQLIMMIARAKFRAREHVGDGVDQAIGDASVLTSDDRTSIRVVPSQ
jgi:hypothetical protein